MSGERGKTPLTSFEKKQMIVVRRQKRASVLKGEPKGRKELWWKTG